MEYTMNRLDEAIYYYLSLHKEELLSINQIYNGLCDGNICPELKCTYSKQAKSNAKSEFTTQCCLLDSKFEGVKKVYQNSTLYLICTDKNINDINIEYKIYDDTVTFDNDDVLENLINTDNWFNKYSIYDKHNSTDTILHTICKKGNNKALRQALKNFRVDPYMQNSNRETLIDVLPRTNEGFEMLKILLEHDCDTKILTLQNQLHELKQQNNKFNSITAKSQTELQLLKQNQSQNKTLYIIMLVIFLFVCGVIL